MMICDIIGEDCSESQHLIQLVIQHVIQHVIQLVIQHVIQLVTQHVIQHENLFFCNKKAHHLLSLLGLTILIVFSDVGGSTNTIFLIVI